MNKETTLKNVIHINDFKIFSLKHNLSNFISKKPTKEQRKLFLD